MVLSLPAVVSFFSAGLPKSPPGVKPLVAVEVLAIVPSFLSLSLGGANRFVVVAGVVSFFSSGFVPCLIAGGPNRPPAPVPPPKEKLGVTDVVVPEVSGFLEPNKLPLNAGVIVGVEVEVELSAGLGGSPKNPPVVAVVGVDESPAGLVGPPNNPPDVAFVFNGAPNRFPEVARRDN